VVTLERELDELDRTDNDGTSSRLRLLKSRAADIREAKKQKNVRTRRNVLGDIRDKLVEYGTSSEVPSV
jgi:hypothetical protein